MITQGIYGIFMAVMAVVIAFIGKWWKENRDSDLVQMAREKVEEWAALVVDAAQTSGVNFDMSGMEKRKFAIEALKGIRDMYKADYTDKQIEYLVDSAYQEMIRNDLVDGGGGWYIEAENVGE